MSAYYATPRPVAAPPNLDAVPTELKALRQWLCWRWIWDSGDQTWDKIPINAKNGTYGSHSDRSTWTTIADAVAGIPIHSCDGIMFVFATDGGYVGIDLDHCRAKLTGDLSPLAQKTVSAMGSYTEASTREEGVHIIGRGKIPGVRRRNDKLGIEMYQDHRAFIITGNVVQFADIVDIQAPLDTLYLQVFGPDPTPPPAGTPHRKGQVLTDDDIIARCGADRGSADFIELWHGRADANGGMSGGDLSLCNHLAFYSDDAAQIDRIFRQSNRVRSKWNERRGNGTYGSITIAKALADGTSRYAQGEPVNLDDRRRQRQEGGQEPPPGGEEKQEPPEPDTRKLYKLWTDDELVALPPPEMLIESIVPEGGTTILYAAAGVGKSFLAIDWAYRISLGMPWFGLKCTQGDVLYVAAEGQGGLGKRLKAWRQEYYNHAGSEHIRFITHPIYPTHSDTSDTLMASLEAAGLPNPKLIVLDTLARVNDGDENNTQEMSALIAAIDAIRQRFHCAVLIIHHRGHTEGRIRGSSALLGAADAVLVLEKDKDTKILTLKADKMKDAEEFPPYNLTLEVVVVEDVTSCVIALAAGAVTALTDPQRAVLQAVSGSSKSFMELLELTTLKRTTLFRTLKELVRFSLVLAVGETKTTGRTYVMSSKGDRALKTGEFQRSSTVEPE